MAVYEALLLNTVVPQIQAAQAGDSYVMVVNATTPALRITQTGTGDAILVEDAANPDATPFVVTAAGDVGIGTSSPAYKLDVSGSVIRLNNSGSTADIFLTDSGTTNGHVRLRGESNAMKFITGNGISATLDTSGNLGLGVTPSAWSSSVATQVGYGAALSSRAAGNTASDVTHGAYWNGTNWLYQHGSVGATRYQMTGANAGSTHAWFVSAGGTAGDAISFTQAMTLDASGRLLVGVTSGTYALDVGDVSGGNMFRFTRAGVELSSFISAGLPFFGTTSNTSLALMTNSTERARITSGGDVHIATGSSTPSSSVAGQRLGATGFIELSRGSGTTAWDAMSFINGNGVVGTINTNGSATAYNTSSDYRLKDNQQPLANSGAFIDALKPKTWNWKSDGSKGVGFIAHEVQEVSPGTVVGTKDAVDADGKPVMQAMEYGSAEFIANIVAELQSLRARVAQLEQGA